MDKSRVVSLIELIRRPLLPGVWFDAHTACKPIRYILSWIHEIVLQIIEIYEGKPRREIINVKQIKNRRKVKDQRKTIVQKFRDNV